MPSHTRVTVENPEMVIVENPELWIRLTAKWQVNGKKDLLPEDVWTDQSPGRNDVLEHAMTAGEKIVEMWVYMETTEHIK